VSETVKCERERVVRGWVGEPVCVCLYLWVRENFRDSEIVWGLWWWGESECGGGDVEAGNYYYYYFFGGNVSWGPESVVVHLLACPAASRRTPEKQSVCSVARSRQYRPVGDYKFAFDKIRWFFVLFLFLFFIFSFSPSQLIVPTNVFLIILWVCTFIFCDCVLCAI